MTAFGTDSDFTVALTAEMPTFSVTQAENNRHIAMTDLIIDGAFNLNPIPTFTLKTINGQIADGTLTGNGTIGLQTRPQGNLIKQIGKLITHPIAYTGQVQATDIQIMPLLSMFVQLPDFPCRQYRTTLRKRHVQRRQHRHFYAQSR